MGLCQPSLATQSPSCKDGISLSVDLRKDFGALRNPGKSGWCYGYAASDAYSQYLFQRGFGPDTRIEGNQVSAVSAALTGDKLWRGIRLDHLNQTFLNGNHVAKPTLTGDDSVFNPDGGGDPRELMREQLRQPICRASQIPESLDKLGDARQNLFVIDKFLNSPTSKTRCEAAQGLQQLFPNSQLSQVQDALSSFLDEDPAQRLLDSNCGNNERLPVNLLPLLIKSDRRENALANIDEALANKRAAVIGFRMQMLLNTGGNHAASIVGKGKNCANGETQYLLRNSWGKEACRDGIKNWNYVVKPTERVCHESCELFGMPVPCQTFCEDNSEEVRIAREGPQFRCTDDGYFIVPARQLTTYLNTSAYYKNQGN